jgi:hypothetical protein
MVRGRSVFAVLMLVGLLGCSRGGTVLLNVKYDPLRAFPSLQQKVGPTLGLAPFNDERPDTLYIGLHTPLNGLSTYFKSEPFPLEKALKASLSQVLERQEVRTEEAGVWDGSPESLKTIPTDSVLRIDIKRFWSEGKAEPFSTRVRTSIQMVLHLGVKREGKVYTRTIELDREHTVFRSNPGEVEAMINAMLTEIFDSYLASPF